MKKCVFVFLLSVLFSLHGAPPITQEAVELLSPKLNSDRIAYFFGSYGVEPVQVESSPFGAGRISNLYSMHDGEKIMRTLAIVQFVGPVPEKLAKVHESIEQGKSIGIALREYGWSIEKKPVYFGSVRLSDALRAWMQDSTEEEAAVHIYQLNVSKNDPQEPYCTIIEVHSPHYLDEGWLRDLHADQWESITGLSLDAMLLMDALDELIHNFPPREVK